MTKSWQPYARHILDAIAKIRRIVARGDLCQDEVLYDAALRNLQTLSEATQHLPEFIKQQHPTIGSRSAASAIFWCTIISVESIPRPCSE